MFEPLMPFMDSQTERWIMVDLPGYGETRASPGEFTVDGAVMELIRFAAETGLERVRWVGHSMGGLVIQRLAHKAPERVASLAGIAPVPMDGLLLGERAREIYRAACTEEDARFRVLKRLAGPATGHAAIGRWVTQSRMETREDALCTYLESWSVERKDPSTPAPGTIPFVLVVGAADPAITKTLIAKSIAPFYGHFELRVLNGIGHLPVEEDAAGVAQALARWWPGSPAA
jgi:pyruvate dehydrogenase E2 component (dihydrolipoamide acetyltransferase)